MNAVVNTRTRGLVQITKDENKVWTCSIVIYGEETKLSPVKLSTKDVIKLLRMLGAPAPVSKKESHIVEFYNAPKWVDLKELGFFVAS